MPSAASPTDWEALFAFYPKISIRVRNVLSPNVLYDRFICDNTRTRDEKPPGPQMATPALLVQMAELLQ